MIDIIHKITALLDDNQIRYLSIIHSKVYTEEEMAVNDYNLGNELVDSVLIRVNNTEIAMLIVPSMRKISLESLQKELKNTSVNFIGRKEMQKLFPAYSPDTMPPFGCLYNMPVYCIAEMKNMQEVTFYTGTRSYRIRMKAADFFKILAPSAFIPVITTPRYRADINAVIPQSKRNSFAQGGRCILGISLENKNFVTAKLVGMVDWISRHFESCTILIADSIHHYSLEIKGVDENYSYDKALRLGREAIDTNNPIFQRYSERCSINILLCSEVQTWKNYFIHYEEVVKLFDNSESFSQCLHNFADTFVERRYESDVEYFRKSIQKSCTYLLEELAILACLSEQGNNVFVYPGDLRALSEISEGLHPDAPQALKDLTCVELKTKRCGSS
jgi:tRNA-dependent cyclodipeptide synthase